MDVVDPENESKWSYPPFSAQTKDTKLYGRGSTDMKSGLVAMVIAMIELKDATPLFNGTIMLLATVGEEIGEVGAAQLTAQHYVDDLDRLIIGEPTGYNLIYTHMGSINYYIVSHGKEAHSSMPSEWYNSINQLNLFITEINKQMGKIATTYVNEALGRTIHNVTVISGGNQVNSIPREAKLQGNIRSIPEFDNEKIITVLKKTIAKLNENEPYKLELMIDYNKIPVHNTKDSSLIQAIQAQFMTSLPLIGLSGTTDATEFTKSEKNFNFVFFDLVLLSILIKLMSM